MNTEDVGVSRNGFEGCSMRSVPPSHKGESSRCSRSCVVLGFRGVGAPYALISTLYGTSRKSLTGTGWIETPLGLSPHCWAIPSCNYNPVIRACREPNWHGRRSGRGCWQYAGLRHIARLGSDCCGVWQPISTMLSSSQDNGLDEVGKA